MFIKDAKRFLAIFIHHLCGIYLIFKPTKQKYDQQGHNLFQFFYWKKYISGMLVNKNNH